MRYSADLRKRVLDFVNEGGSITAASRTFCISRMCIYTWLKSEDPLTSKKPGPRGPYRLNYEALKQHVIDFPDHTQLERASHFGVSKHCIWYALKKLKITRKKQFGYKEQCAVKRDTYVSALTAALCEGKTPVYIDESGFTLEAVRHYAYAPRGTIVSDMRSSQQYRSTSLIAARLSDDFIAPLLFTGACTPSVSTNGLKHTYVRIWIKLMGLYLIMRDFTKAIAHRS